jgi:flagellar motor switch protein FliN/FliY
MLAIKDGTPFFNFLDAFVQAASEVFSQALGTPWTVELAAADARAADDAPLQYFQLSVSGQLAGHAAFEFQGPDVVRLAQDFLGETTDPSSDLSVDHLEALIKLLRQVAGVATTRLKSNFGDVTLQLDAAEAPTWTGNTVRLIAKEASGASVRLGLRLSPGLEACFSSVAPTPSTFEVATESDSAPQQPRPAAVNLDRLVGVDLSLTLRFGRRIMTSHEILELTRGSVIELDRKLREPADLLLGDKLIARGEVVVVDGNYGIRVTEVADAML